jgi:uncharacterized protein YbjT (DUF2867 family)
LEHPETNECICEDLPTKPRKDVGKILITGATGYIGGRLVPELILRGYRVRVMVRADSESIKERWPEADVVVADARNLESVLSALEGIDTAYYLIHSLGLGHKKFESVDLDVAVNFRTAAENKNVKRIIYLGGLGDTNSELSAHLQSRIAVAEKLAEGNIPVTVLRAGMIIGSGSASYEILQNLVKNSFFFFIPSWAKTKSQPISIRDVIKYLIGMLESPESAGKTYDIGGTGIVTYDKMLRVLSKIQNKKRIFLPTFINYTPLYGYIASLLTPVPAPIAKVLIAGCKNEVICLNDEARELLDFEPLSYEAALVKAMKIEELDNVSTRWSDAYPPAHMLAKKLNQVLPPPKYTISNSLLSYKPASSIFLSFSKIGGKMGWFKSNWMWRFRGMIDRMLLGVGSSRGRRSYKNLRVGDVIDFWRVENIVKEKLLLLRGEMKLPGEVWLEFSIQNYEGLNKLQVIVYYKPRGIAGHIYWYFSLPFHILIYRDLIKHIEKRS